MEHTTKCPNCLTPVTMKASHAALLEALEGIRKCVTLNRRLADDTVGIIDIGAFWEAWPAAIRALASAEKGS